MPTAINDSWTSALALVPPAARDQIRELIPADPEASFVQFALDAVEGGSTPGASLIQSGVLIPVALEPAVCPLPEAIRLIKACEPAERTLDVRILQAISGAAETARVIRGLELVDAISNCRRLVMPLLKFAKLPDPNVRSKAIKLMARASQNGAWLESILNDRDPRVRSNLIEGLFDQLGDGADALLRRAAKDPHHRVATTALLCLARLGDASSRAKLENLTGDGRELHARAATWALSQLNASNPSSTTPHPSA